MGQNHLPKGTTIFKMVVDFQCICIYIYICEKILMTKKVIVELNFLEI